MNKNRFSFLTVFMVVIGLLFATSVAMADDSLTLTSSISISQSGADFGKLSVGVYNGEAFCALTLNTLTNGKLNSVVPFTVQAADLNVATLTTRGDRLSATVGSGFGVTGITENIGSLPQAAPSNADSIVVWSDNTDVLVSSGNTPVVRVRFLGGECALVFPNPVTDLLIHSTTNFKVGAGVYTPSPTANIGGLTVIEWREGAITGTFGSSDYQIQMPVLPVPGTNVNAVALSLMQQVVVVPTPAFGQVVATSTPALAFGAPTAVAPVGGGANPGVVATLSPQAFPTVANQWVFTNTPGSTNPRQASWQQDLLARVALNPTVWINNVPNADNAAANFVAARDGMEVPPGDMTYGEQDNYLNVYSAGGSIRYISADYNLPALGVECHAQNGIGCLLLIVNTGNTAVTFEDQVVRNGFSFEGVIFNQEKTGTTVWAVASYGVSRMMNMGGGVSGVNQGSNCSITDGCVNGVMVRVVGHSGGFVEWTGSLLYHR